jgi:hypothetical protein
MAKEYWNIVFMQDEAADEAMKILEDNGEEAALEHLKQWDMGGESEIDKTDQAWGLRDDTYMSGEYVMSYNKGLGYIGLAREVKDEQEEYQNYQSELRKEMERKKQTESKTNMKSKTLVESAQRWLDEDVIKEANESNVKLFVKHMIKEVAEDNYEQGEIGKRKLVADEKIGKKFDSFDDFKKYAEKMWYFIDAENAWVVIDNRILYDRLEDDEGNVIETSDVAYREFKEGKRNLWSASYDFVVELIAEVKTDEDSIREFTGIKN